MEAEGMLLLPAVVIVDEVEGELQVTNRVVTTAITWTADAESLCSIAKSVLEVDANMFVQMVRESIKIPFGNGIKSILKCSLWRTFIM